MKMILFVDEIQPFDVGGYTTSLEKINYNLKQLKISPEQLLKGKVNDKGESTVTFHAGKFVVIYQFKTDFSVGRMGFINFETDLDKHFDIFADSFSPKTVEGFHQMRLKIKDKGFNYWNLVELSDDFLTFEILSQN